MKPRHSFIALAAIFLISGGSGEREGKTAVTLSDDDVDNIVRRSYQYVAMYNVNNKFAFKQGGWNTIDADTELKDHTMQDIARPNNDTFYIGCMAVTHAEFGCEDGVHTGWLIVDVDDRETALQMIPPQYRDGSRVILLRKWTQNQIREMVKGLDG